MSITREDLEEAISVAFPEAIINITQLTYDNDHWAVEVIDQSFRGFSRIAQLKMVQAAVQGYKIQNLEITTKVVV